MDNLKNKLITKKPIIIICGTTLAICAAVIIFFNIYEKRSVDRDETPVMAEIMDKTPNLVESDGSQGDMSDVVDNSTNVSGTGADGSPANEEKNDISDSDTDKTDEMIASSEFQDMQEDLVPQSDIDPVSDTKTKPNVSDWKEDIGNKSDWDEDKSSPSEPDKQGNDKTDTDNRGGNGDSSAEDGVKDGVKAHIKDNNTDDETSNNDSTVIEEMQSDDSSTGSNSYDASEGKNYETIRIPVR